MKILIFGGNGMLGHKLVQVLGKKFDVWTTFRGKFREIPDGHYLKKDRVFENVDVQDEENYREVVKNLRPDVILNAVGVIKQKAEAKDVVKTLEINSIFPHKVGEIARELDARFITFSTDCVFSGKKGNYTETDISDVFDLYGKSKNFGEVSGKNCLTLRTSIIGREISNTKSLVEWFLSQKGNKIEGFTKAIYSGFPTVVLAEIISDIISKYRDLEGIYHLSSDPISKYDLLNLIKTRLDLDIKIEPAGSVRIDRSLDSSKFRAETGFEPESWESMIERMFEDPTPYGIIRKTDKIS